MAEERTEEEKVKTSEKGAGSAEYKRCKKYFSRRLKERKAEIEELSAGLCEAIEKDKTAYRNIGKKSAVFYGDNPFGFFMLSGLILLPFAVICVLIRLCGSSGLVSLIPIFVALTLIAVRVVMRLIKRVKARWEIASLKADSMEAEKDLKAQYDRYTQMNARRKRLRKLFKRLKKNPSMSDKQLANLRKEFEKIDSEEKEDQEE